MVRGGGETFDLEMARHLAGLGCEITFLAGRPVFKKPNLGPEEWWRRGGEMGNGRGTMGDSPIAHGPSSISTYTIRTPYAGWFPWDKVRGGWRLRNWDFRCFERTAARWAWRRRHEFDVIQVCELPFFVDDFKRMPADGRPPVVLRLTAPDFFDPSGALSRADAVIASGATLRVVRAGPRPDCHDIANGVDVGLFRPHASRLRQEEGWSDEDRVVVFVARFQSVKNHAMLVEAFRLLLGEEPRARLALAGSGPLESTIRRQCAELGVSGRVSFLGEVPFQRVADLYAAADLNVISSDYESFSFVALESMASGLPLVATATDWVPTLIGGTSATPGDVPGGVVVPKGGSRQMAAAMAGLLRDPETARRKGAWNRQRVVQDFGWPSSAWKLLGVYQSLLEKAT